MTAINSENNQNSIEFTTYVKNTAKMLYDLLFIERYEDDTYKKGPVIFERILVPDALYYLPDCIYVVRAFFLFANILNTFSRLIDGSNFENILIYLTHWAIHATTFSLLFSIYASYIDDPLNEMIDYKALSNIFTGLA